MSSNLTSAKWKSQACLWTGALALFVACSAESETPRPAYSAPSAWIRIDDFESPDPLQHWVLLDAKNDTSPRIEKPQVTEVRVDEGGLNRYLIKKPAAEGVVGNRKALSFRKLPRPVAVGETYTFYTRFNVEYFPNNHMFGLSNLPAEGIARHDYNAFEPTLRVTDKLESDGTRNDGTLMVNREGGHSKIFNFQANTTAKPLQTNTWYEVWYVVHNGKVLEGGQSYDVHLRGGDEFPRQQKVFTAAEFRMKRELPLIYFLANCNTGPANAPYGNGGLRYDDLYMAEGVELTSPRE